MHLDAESKHSAFVLAALAKCNVDAVEADAVIPYLIGAYDIRIPDAWFRTAASGGTLGDRVHEAKRALEKEREKAELKAAARTVIPRLVEAAAPRVEPVYVGGAKPAAPRVRGCGGCKWGYVQIGGESVPCSACADIAA